jgi:hypothetical protein
VLGARQTGTYIPNFTWNDTSMNTTHPPLADCDSLELIDQALDSGAATGAQLAELAVRLSVALVLSQGLDDLGLLDDPETELAAIRAGAAAPAALEPAPLGRTQLPPAVVAKLRIALQVHISHLQFVRLANRRRASIPVTAAVRPAR